MTNATDQAAADQLCARIEQALGVPAADVTADPELALRSDTCQLCGTVTAVATLMLDAGLIAGGDEIGEPVPVTCCADCLSSYLNGDIAARG
jgi:hypothetical protein